MIWASPRFGHPHSHIPSVQPRPQGAFPWLRRWGREKRPGDEVA